MQRPELDPEQLAAAARIRAMIDDEAADDRPDAQSTGAARVVRDISRDPIVLGDVLGDYLHRIVVGTQAQTIRYWPVLDVLRAAGADEHRAAVKALWLRHRLSPEETSPQLRAPGAHVGAERGTGLGRDGVDEGL